MAHIIVKCEYCGKEFLRPKWSFNKGRIPRYCSRSCSSSANNKNRLKERVLQITEDRPLTPDTVFFVKTWAEQGDSPEQIAEILNRPLSTIEAILRGELK